MFFWGATAALTLLFCPQIKGATMHSWLNLERSPLNRKPAPTLPETNMFAPKNGGFQYQSPFPGGPHFQGRAVSFRVGNVDCLYPILGTSIQKNISSPPIRQAKAKFPTTFGQADRHNLQANIVKVFVTPSMGL